MTGGKRHPPNLQTRANRPCLESAKPINGSDFKALLGKYLHTKTDADNPLALLARIHDQLVKSACPQLIHGLRKAPTPGMMITLAASKSSALRSSVK